MTINGKEYGYVCNHEAFWANGDGKSVNYNIFWEEQPHGATGCERISKEYFDSEEYVNVHFPKKCSKCGKFGGWS